MLAQCLFEGVDWQKRCSRVPRVEFALGWVAEITRVHFFRKVLLRANKVKNVIRRFGLMRHTRIKKSTNHRRIAQNDVKTIYLIKVLR